VIWGCASSQGPAEVNPRQSRFSKADNGLITDRVAGLDWYICPQRDNQWRQAKVWAEGLAVDGGGWRLPTMAELKGLYQKGASAVNMDPVFQLPGAYVWSGDLHNDWSVWGFAFYSGLEGWHSMNYGYGRVALAVRSRK